MKIAIPSDEGTYLSQHFGRTLGFTIFEVSNGQIINQEYRPNNFTGHSLGQHQEHQHHGADHDDHAQHSHNRILNALNDCEVVIAGGMGRRLVDDLTYAGKKIYITTIPETRKAVEMFLEDKLISDKESCSHHE
jgi:predicted Fe-Mo cluster-binding NifX family protein